MQVWSLDQEDPLEEGMATHSSILAWKIPWTKEPGQLQSSGSQRVGHDWSSWAHTGGPGGRGESRTPQSCRINPGSILGGVLKEDQGGVRLGWVGDKEGVQFWFGNCAITNSFIHLVHSNPVPTMHLARSWKSSRDWRYLEAGEGWRGHRDAKACPLWEGERSQVGGSP